jgi:hypothetical protein
MAILIQNTTQCPLCGQVLTSRARALSFPAMVWNELDPLLLVSDATVHVSCLERHGLLEAALARMREVTETTGPGKRKCLVCGQQVTTPDEHLAFGHLTRDPKVPLFAFNYAQFHRSCLSRWQRLLETINLLEDFNKSGLWKGRWLGILIEELRKAAQTSR